MAPQDHVHADLIADDPRAGGQQELQAEHRQGNEAHRHREVDPEAASWIEVDQAEDQGEDREQDVGALRPGAPCRARG